MPAVASPSLPLAARAMATLRRWFDTQVHAAEEAGRDPRIDWLRAAWAGDGPEAGGRA